MEAKTYETFDITPNWEPLINPLIDVLLNKKAKPQSHADARTELNRAGRAADGAMAVRQRLLDVDRLQALIDMKDGDDRAWALQEFFDELAQCIRIQIPWPVTGPENKEIHVGGD